MKTKINPTAARKIAFPAAVFCLQKLKGDNFLTKCLPFAVFYFLKMQVKFVETKNIFKVYCLYITVIITLYGGKVMYNKVFICGVDTSKLPVLKEREKEELLKEVKNGSKTAREKLINGNLRLVLSVIQRFTARGENLDDLFQVGCIGLIKSIDNFDVAQNVKFSTYAVPMIIGEIRRYLRDNNPIRVRRSIKDTAYKAMQD